MPSANANSDAKRVSTSGGLSEVHKRLAWRRAFLREKGEKGRRVSAAALIARAIYVTAQGERVVVLHAFVKKTRKTPQRALEIARERAKEVQ